MHPCHGRDHSFGKHRGELRPGWLNGRNPFQVGTAVICVTLVV
jgi:hypothetical protein